METAEDKLARLERMAATGTAESFLACDDDTKRLMFALMVEDSSRRKAAEARASAAEGELEKDREAANLVREAAALIGTPEDNRKRAQELEAALTALREKVVEVVGPFAEEFGPDFPRPDDFSPYGNLTMGHFRAAAALHSELTAPPADEGVRRWNDALGQFEYVYPAPPAGDPAENSLSGRPGSEAYTAEGNAPRDKQQNNDPSNV